MILAAIVERPLERSYHAIEVALELMETGMNQGQIIEELLVQEILSPDNEELMEQEN